MNEHGSGSGGLEGYLVPTVREVEDRLPDHDAVDYPGVEEEIASMPARWSRKQKMVTVGGGLVLIAVIVGLGWLQGVVMTRP